MCHDSEIHIQQVHQIHSIVELCIKTFGFLRTPAAPPPCFEENQIEAAFICSLDISDIKISKFVIP